MDPLTHGLVGAAASQTFSDREKLRPAAIAGAASAMLADLDIFLHHPSDPLFNIEIHRQFTHSLVFIPAGALIASLLLWFLLKKHLSFRELYLSSLAGYATAGILDSFTSYGTQLLWPFFETRYAFNIISVVDPLVTIGLILFLTIAILKKKQQMVWLAGGWLTLFLLFGWLQHHRATSAAEEQIHQRGHRAERLIVKPTIGNQVLWRATYIYNDRIYADAVRTGILPGITFYEGVSEPQIIIEQAFSDYKGTTLYNDLLRFEKLSESFLIRHPGKPEIIGDARYSMLPAGMIPLWGVKTDTTHTDRHLPFRYFRDANDEIRTTYLNMLLGRRL